MTRAKIVTGLGGALAGIAIVATGLFAGVGSIARAAAVPVALQQSHARDSAHFAEWLKNEVHHQLALLPYYSIFDNLEYSIDGANVTLQGQVVHGTLKDDAENAVKKIEEWLA